MIRTIIAFALVLCLAAAWAVFEPQNGPPFEVQDQPQAIADGVFLDADGRERHLSEFTGKTLAVNLWATWCAPCVKELPSLDRLQAQLGSDHFQVLALSLDRGGVDAARAFFEHAGIKHLEAYADPTSKLGFVLHAPGLPTTLILDPQGRETARISGALEWDSKPVIEWLKRRIGA